MKNCGNEVKAIEQLVKKDLALYFGQARALSVEKGRIAVAIEGKATRIISEGIELGTKELPHRFGLERQAIEDLCAIALTEGKEKALEYVRWLESLLEQKSIPKEQLYFETKHARLNYFDYLRKDERIRALKEYKIMEGEQFKGIYAKGKEGISIDADDELDYSRYYKKLLTTLKPFVAALKDS